MSLTAEQTAELAEETLTEETQPSDAPESGEQPATETPAEDPAADPPAEGEAPEGEPNAPPPEKTPEQQRAWAQVAAAKKAQVQVAQARAKLEQDAERVRTYEAQLEQRAQQLETQQRQLDQVQARVRPLLDALERRDLNALVALGFDYDAFTREQISANTPEAIAKRVLEDNRKLREQLEKDKTEREQREQQQRQVTETREIANKLVEIVDTSADEFPELYQWAPERIAQEGLEIRAAVYRAQRQMPTYGFVLNELQKRAKAEADISTQRRTALEQRKSAKPSDAGSAGKADPSKGASGSPGTPALTGPTANQRLTPPREKTEAEIDEECLAMLRGIRR